MKKVAASRAHSVTGKRTVNPDKMKAVKELMARINGRGPRLIAFANEVENTSILRRPSGIMNLDIATGGGLPAGGMSYIAGPNNAGKTYLMFLYMLMNQKLRGKDSAIAYIAVEDSFDYLSAREVGLEVALPPTLIDQMSDSRRLQGLPEFNNEELSALQSETGILAVSQPTTGESALETALDTVKSKQFDIVFIDSMSAIRPSAEFVKDLDKSEKMAARASLITRFDLNYNASRSSLSERNDTTVICSSQVRSNQERANMPAHLQKYVKSWAEQKASSSGHFRQIAIQVDSGEKIYKKIAGHNVVIGKTINWKLTKGKQGAHDNVQGEAPFYYGEFASIHGVDLQESVISEALACGVLHEGKNGIFLMTTKEGVKLADTQEDLKMSMRTDFEAELVIRNKILAARGKPCLYR